MADDLAKVSDVQQAILNGAFWPVSADTQARAQFYDCKRCRAIVIDRKSHADWHKELDLHGHGG